MLTFFIAGLLFICALSTSITWERTASRRRPAFSSHLLATVNFRIALIRPRLCFMEDRKPFLMTTVPEKNLPEKCAFRYTIVVITGPKMLPALALALAATLLAEPAGQTQDQAGRLSIVVDKSCRIQPESDPLVLGD